MSSNNAACTGEDIAIISAAGRFPGAADINMFWKNIKNGVESITFFTDEELRKANIDPGIYSDSNYVRAAAIIEDIEMFDAEFFGFNPREAEILNPQHRMFLECAWEALESAGYNPEVYKGRIGVYAGEGLNTYLLGMASNPELMKTLNEIQMLIGNDKDFLSTQVSYKFNLKGPGVTVQTACSTSLTAVSMACQALRNYQCDMALAGGIRLGLPQKAGYMYKEGGILSPDGHCKPFDERANGTVGGNGAGIVVLKRLEDALEDGDYIYAVIKGTAINNDGSLKIGYTAPSIEGQAEAIYEALQVGGVNPETIGYIEAHGTGTELGDPIEIAALTKVFRNHTKKQGFCALGSVKANVGHMDAAAGVAGVIKTALALKNRIIPPCINFEKPNPKINLGESPFYVPTSPVEWETDGTPRRAGVSSFGIGGTNVHAVMEEAPEIESSQSARKWHIITLSARNENVLENMTVNLAQYLKNNPLTNLGDAAYTLQTGRKEFDYRKAIICSSGNDAVEIMEKPHHERITKGCIETGRKDAVFMFPGQGSQYINMGLELYENEQVFREQVDLCSKILEPHIGHDLRKILYPEEKELQPEQINQTYLAQPALFTIEYAAAKTLMNYGIIPKAMIGHSIGEYVAACLAGVFTIHEVLPLIAARGRMMQGQPHGVMTAVSSTEQEVRQLLDENVSIAAVNSPVSCVISGPEEKVKELEMRLEEKGIGFVRLHTSHAFHSSMMNSIIEPFTEKVRKLKLNAPTIPIISNVSGTWLKDEEAKNPEYWARHLAGTVCFSKGIEELLKNTSNLLIEVGPGNTLSTLTKQHIKKDEPRSVISTMRHPREKGSDEAYLYCALGRMWVEGITVTWSEIYKKEKRMRIPLPTYPFERQRYWIESGIQMHKAIGSNDRISKNTEVSEWFYTPCWKPSAPVGVAETDQNSTNWLIFADECSLAEKVITTLKDSGKEVTVVYPGEKFRTDENGVYEINPHNTQEYHELFTSMAAINKLPEKIIHMWCATDRKESSETTYFEEMQEKGFYSLISITRAFEKLKVTSPVRMSIITSNMQSVCGEGELYPEKATVLGACRVIPQEYINLSCISIDITIPEQNTPQEEFLAASIINETSLAESKYAIAYRGNIRWLQGFENIKPQAQGLTTYLRKGGVYLITGGLGNIGLIFAQYLAKEYGAKLVLTGRSGFPAKSQWEEWLTTHGHNDETSKKILKLKEIEELGAEVLIYSADVSSEEQMKEVISGIINQFGVINGVIHGAGVIGEKTYTSIRELDRNRIAEQFKAKIQGTCVLEKLLKDVKIDFCLLVSSLSAVLGGLGLAAYSAANSFMDAFVYRYNRENAIPWISVDWDGWSFTDKDTSPDGLFIAPSEGGKALNQVLLQGMMKNLVVSTGELKHRIERWVTQRNLKPAKKLHARQGTADSYEPPRNDLEQKITDIWSDLLGIEKVGINDDFFELGGNSLLATQVIYRMRAEIHVDMPIKSFFEAPTVSGISEKLEEARANEKKLAEAIEMVKALSKIEADKLLQEIKGEGSK